MTFWSVILTSRNFLKPKLPLLHLTLVADHCSYSAAKLFLSCPSQKWFLVCFLVLLLLCRQFEVQGSVFSLIAACSLAQSQSVIRTLGKCTLS